MFAGITFGRLLLKFWYVPVLAAMAFGLWVQHKDVKLARMERDTATAALEQAQEVNKRNKAVIRQMDMDKEAERKITEQAIAAEQARTAELNAIKEELRNAPGATDPADPYFDALGDRLRGLNPKISH